MDKYEGAIDVDGMTCGSCVNTIENNVGVIPGVFSVKVDLSDKEASVVLDPTVVTMNEILDKINSMGFVASQRKPTEDTTEVHLSLDSTSHGETDDQTDLASTIFSAAGAGNLERGDQPTSQKPKAAVGGPEGVSRKIGEVPGNVGGLEDLEEKVETPKKQKRRLSTKPAHVSSPDLHPVVEKKITVAVFDVETSGPGISDEVIQLSATSNLGSFNSYILPLGKIKSMATDIHHISKRDGKLFHGKNPVPAKIKEEAWRDFINFCEKISPVLLVGHNVMFDARFTIRELANVNLTEDFLKVVAGFSDSLPLMRSIFPDLESHSQGRIVSEVMGPNYKYDCHNSEADVASLMEVLKKLNVSDEKLMEYSFTATSYVQHLKNKKEEEAMQVLFSPRVVTKPNLKELVAAGYTLMELEKLANTKDQEHFINTLLPVLPKKEASVRIYEIIRNF